MQEIERSAGSVEEAVEAALAELGLSEQEAEIEIVQEPRAGFLGLNYGRRTPISVLLAHLVYGTVLGAFYEVKR